MLWLVLVAVVSVFIYLKVIKPLSFWKDRGVVCEKSWPLLGNMASSLFRKQAFMERAQDCYTAFPGERYNGVHQFTKPVLIVRDLNLIKQITVKDFDYFTDHYAFVSEEVDPVMGRNLFSLTGQRWRDMRATLSPSFTSSKMRTMFMFLSECADQFTKHFEKQSSDKVITLEMKDAFTRYTNDAIASIAFGLKVDSLEERNNEFYLMGKKAMNFSGFRTFAYVVLFNLSPILAKYLKLTFFPQHVLMFFQRIIKDTMKQREEQGIVRPDMIHLLMEAQKGRLKHENEKETIDAGFATVEESQVGKVDKHQKTELTDDDIMAQALIFFLGGFETSATLMSFIAYELAINPNVQEKLQTEVDGTLRKCNGKITYEALLGMKYLDMVVSETLRKWPPGFQIDRVCVKDYLIKPERPSEGLLTVEKGQLVIIPVIGIHLDPKIFPNPHTFDPERFSDENKHKIESASYMPFGAGPRSCIASRFALLESKTLFCHLISKFEIVVVKKTPIPLRMGKNTCNMAPDEGFWLGLKHRKVLHD